MISTHNGADSEFNRWIEDINSGRKPGRVYRTTFDDALADGYYMRNIANLPAFKKRGYKKSKKWEAKYREEILRMADEDADEEFHVIPRASAGVYIPKHLAMQCQLKTATVLRRQYDKDEWSKHLDIRRREMQNWISDVLEVHRKRWTHCGPMVLGYDYGAVSDPACFYLFRDTPHGPVTEWSYEAKLLPVEQQETILAWFLEGFPGLHTVNMDKTGPGHDIWQRIASRFGEARGERDQHLRCLVQVRNPGTQEEAGEQADPDPPRRARDPRSLGLPAGEQRAQASPGPKPRKAGTPGTLILPLRLLWLRKLR